MMWTVGSWSAHKGCFFLEKSGQFKDVYLFLYYLINKYYTIICTNFLFYFHIGLEAQIRYLWKQSYLFLLFLILLLVIMIKFIMKQPSSLIEETWSLPFLLKGLVIRLALSFFSFQCCVCTCLHIPRCPVKQVQMWRYTVFFYTFVFFKW